MLSVSPPLITYEQPSPKRSQEIYKSMAIPARARAPIPATSLLAAPVYLATAGPVVVGAAQAAEPEAVPEIASTGLAEVVGLAEHVLG